MRALWLLLLGLAGVYGQWVRLPCARLLVRLGRSRYCCSLAAVALRCLVALHANTFCMWPNVLLVRVPLLPQRDGVQSPKLWDQVKLWSPTNDDAILSFLHLRPSPQFTITAQVFPCCCGSRV